jgi:hypothetical protein
MSTVPDNSRVKRPFRRPALAATGPDRRAGGFYRTADNEDGTLPGLALTGAEDAVVAAVRLGYKVAAAQIERSARLAKRLRDAGERAAGPDSERQALDATERLLFDSMMAGLAWLEGVAADPSCPLKRLAAAEYRLLGSLFGLTPGEAAAKPPHTAPAATNAGGDAAAARPPQTTPVAPLRIVLLGAERRAVRVRAWEIAPHLAPAELPVVFYSTQMIDAPPLEAEVSTATTPPTLRVTTWQRSPAGPWRAAVCLPDGEQVGIIEIGL